MHRALVGATLAAAFVGVTVLAQSTTPASTSAPLTPILGGKKLTPPVKGDASLDFLSSPTKREGTMLVTKIQVKNTSNAPIARPKIAITWYDKTGSNIPGGDGFVNGLLQPGEIQTIEVRSPTDSKIDEKRSPMFQFTHANGGIPKPHRVTKFDDSGAAAAKEPAAKNAAATKPVKKK